MNPLLIAFGASLGNALFIYSQRASPAAPNPFLFSAGTVLFATFFCGFASFLTKSDTDIQYLLNAWPYMIFGGLGVFITFVGFFLLHTGYGASQYSLVAVSSIFTVSIFVGVFVFKEQFNWLQWIATALAVGAIVLFSIGRGWND